MRWNPFFFISLAALFAISCSHDKIQGTMGIQEDIIFPKGEPIGNDNFTGKVWLEMLVQSDSTLNTQIGNVTFEPGARTNWHTHSGGQILLVTEGNGYYQERGKPIQPLEKGDVIRCSPEIEHWHGASPNSTLTHIAISPNLNKGGVIWLKPVSDKEYNNK